MKRKIGIALIVVVVLFVGTIAFGIIKIFGSNKPVEPGATYARVSVVEDVPYVAMFLVDIGGGKYVLVDGGADQAGEAVRAALAAKGAGVEDLEAILFTHAHGDHVAAAYGLLDVPLWVHDAEVDMAEGREGGTSTFGKLVGPNPPGLKVAKTFKGGDVLTFGEASIEVFHAPGHTAGNCAFLVDGVLLLGDTAQITTDDSVHAPPDVFTNDPAQAIASIRALGIELKSRETKPTVMVGAHSGSTTKMSGLFEYGSD